MIEHLPDWARAAVTAARERGPDIDAALQLAREVGPRLPLPGRGATAQRWAVLAALARADVTVARVVEAHTDALAVLAEAGEGVPAGSWGVFAAESPTDRVVAAGGTLSGVKPWCSLGGRLDAALVTAHLPDGGRGLYAVDLHHPGVTAQPPSGWVSRGLPGVVSVGLEFDAVPARPVGGPDWYLQRGGFAWGGMGVAACWFGAAQGVADRVPAGGDALRALARGRVDVALHAASCTLRDAAVQVDDGSADGPDGQVLALRVRSAVAAAAERVLAVVGRDTGPAPLAFDERHAARVADLGIYLRQHHGERDLATLGELLDGPR